MVGNVVLAEVEPEERESFEQFKEAVHDLKQEDWVLIRFLRARNYDIAKADDMLRYALQWREEIDMKNYLNWEFPQYYKSEIAYQIFGKDFEGAPVLWVPIGRWNGKHLVENGEGANLLRWAFAMFERGLRTIQEHDSQGHIIVDLDGLTYSQATHIASLKWFVQGCQKVEQCYPEIIKSAFVINAPWVFTLGFSFIKGIITRKTMAKIRIFGCNKDEWLPELLRKFPVDSIIPELTKDINGN